VAEADCLFCKMVAGAIPVDKLHDDDLCIAIRDIHPLAPVHVLIIPKTHLASVNALSEGEATLLGRMFSVAKRLAAAEALADRGYRLTFNTGPDAGQSVLHLHLHLLGGRDLGASVS
jgi:histidine triad (HIT) family protein